MTSPALSAAPRNALLIWTDGRDLFTELPGPNGPHVLRFHRTTTGLTQALRLIETHAFDALDRTSPSPPPAPARAGTIAQQLTARDLLRRMRIIP